MTLSSGLAIAVGGLANIDRQLSLVAHNVSNAHTPGYVKEIAVQTSVTAEGMGLGVRSGPAIRMTNATLQADIRHQTSVVADLQTRSAALGAIGAVQGTPGSGTDLASMLGAVRDAFSRLASNPADPAGQRATVDTARTLARGINTLADTYATQRQNAQDSAYADIDRLNQSLAQIGSFSQHIIRLQAMGESTADLENQRDTAIAQVTELIDVRVQTQANGDVLLISAQGMILPTQGTANPFSLAAANLAAGAWYPAGGVPGIMLGGVDVTGQFGAGRIGANLTLRDDILPEYQAALDEFAQTLSQRFSNQGLALFTDPAGNIPPGGGLPTQTGYIGYAGIIQVNPAIDADATLLRDGTQAVVGSPSGASAFTPNPIGGPAGDTTLIQRILRFTLGAEIQPGVTQPPSAITGLGPAGNITLSFPTPATLAEFTERLIASPAADQAGITAQLEMETALLTTVQSKFDAATGVDVDSEMAMMIQLQNAYGAHARVIATMQSMWDQLLGAVR